MVFASVYLGNSSAFLSFPFMSVFALMSATCDFEKCIWNSLHLQFFQTVLRKISIISLKIWWNSPVKLFDARICFVGSFNFSTTILVTCNWSNWKFYIYIILVIYMQNFICLLMMSNLSIYSWMFLDILCIWVYGLPCHLFSHLILFALLFSTF